MSATLPQNLVVDAGEVEQTIETLNAITDRLVETIEQETRHVRAGRLREAADLGELKAELAHRYAAESSRLMANRVLIARSQPEAYAALRERHNDFQALLQTNMTVLATAHAVSEGIIRGVSGELARKRAPSTYGASGRTNLPGTKANQPIAVCRTL
ncbi:MAG TPA: hypothetical protein VFW22_09780 [Pseudolabrys sp.]|nr:hypothetical protein [Pseudolabrys sp.]